jgi:hypothetical protein
MADTSALSASGNKPAAAGQVARQYAGVGHSSAAVQLLTHCPGAPIDFRVRSTAWKSKKTRTAFSKPNNIYRCQGRVDRKDV